MKMTQKMEEELNKQVNAEMYSAYLYLSMSANFMDKNLNGFANWMYVQAQEEMTHAMKIYNFILERGGRVFLDAIEKPKEKWSTPLEAFEDAYEHEQKVTKMIENLVNLAEEDKDYATNSMLQWFIDEQVEEEANASEIVEKLKLMKDAPGALFMMDKEMAARVFVDETQGTAE